VPWLLPRNHGDIALLAQADGPVAVVNANRAAGDRVEVAVLVAPEWRRHGVASRVLRHLRDRLPRTAAVTAHVQGDNVAALRLLRRITPDAAMRYQGEVVLATVPLPR